MPIRQIVLFAVVLMALLSSVIAQASEWPTYRHDQQRSGRAQGVGAIETPVSVWEHYLGGKLAHNQAWFGDVNGDSVKDIGLIEGGKVVLRNFDGDPIWFSAEIGADSIAACQDFNGDGLKELLVLADGPPAALGLLDGHSGETLWLFNDFDQSATRFPLQHIAIVDFTGDGLADIIAKPGYTYLHSHAFSFESGFSANPMDNRKWSFQGIYGNNTPLLAGDTENGGSVELVLFENRRLTIVNAEEGLVKAQIDDVWESYSFGWMGLANIDTDPQNEIIGIGSSYYNYALTVYDAKRGEISWQYQYYPTTGKSLKATGRSLGDLDGDGAPELVVSIFNDIDDELKGSGSQPGDHDGINEPDTWSLAVFAASDGSLVAHLPDTVLRGLVDMGVSGKTIILAQANAMDMALTHFGELQAFSLVDGALEKQWSIQNAQVAVMPAEHGVKANHDGSIRICAVQDLDLDEIPEIYLYRDDDENGIADRVCAYKVNKARAIEYACHDIAGNETISLLELGDDLASQGSPSQSVLFSSLGEIKVLDRNFDQVSSFKLGGYRTEALSADLDDDGQLEVIVAASNRDLRVLDVSDASPTSPPTLLWSYNGHLKPFQTITDLDDDGKKEIPVRSFADPVNPSLSLLDHGGNLIWEHVFKGYGVAPMQMVTGYFNDDTVQDIVVAISDIKLASDEDLRLVALDGTDGSEIWNVPATTNYVLSTPLLSHDFDGDGYNDLLLVGRDVMEYYSGADGSLAFAMSGTWWSFGNLLADFDGDEELEVLVSNHSSTLGLQLFEAMADTPDWTVEHGNEGELGKAWVGLLAKEGGYSIMKPTNFGSIETIHADGSIDEDSLRYVYDGEVHGSSSGFGNEINGISVADINGDGIEDALFGTADGYLMAIDSEELKELWNLNFGMPTASPIMADVDSDNELEILVSAEDGYLRMIDEQGLSAVSQVRDCMLDENEAIIDPLTDTDASEDTGAFGVSWDLVDNATGYRLSLLDGDENTIVSNLDVGEVSQYVLDVELVVGKSYHASVSAYDAEGDISFDTVSDGAEIVDVEGPSIENFRISSTLMGSSNGPLNIEASLRDRSKLLSYTLEFIDEENEIVSSLKHLLNQREYELFSEWHGRDDAGNDLPDGEYLLRLVVLDAGDHEALAEAEFAIDRTAPAKPVILEPGEGQIIESSSPLFLVESEEGSTVELFDVQGSLCTGMADESGFATCRPASMNDGDHGVYAVAYDLAENRSQQSETRHFEIDSESGNPPGCRKPVGCRRDDANLPGLALLILFPLRALLFRRRRNETGGRS